MIVDNPPYAAPITSILVALAVVAEEVRKSLGELTKDMLRVEEIKDLGFWKENNRQEIYVEDHCFMTNIWNFGKVSFSFKSHLYTYNVGIWMLLKNLIRNTRSHYGRRRI
jgi:hypothetical protein